MSDFTAPAFVGKYQKDLEKAAREAQLMQKLAESLVPTAPQPTDARPFGYCADLGLKFAFEKLPAAERAAKVKELLAAYPAMPLVDLPDVRTQKPVEYLRENERAEACRDIYPVVFKYEAEPRRPDKSLELKAPGAARWWTRLAGSVVELDVRGAEPSDLDLPGEGLYADSHSYATGAQTMFHRRLKEYPLTYADGLEGWFGPLDKFRASLRSPAARMVANAAIDRMVRAISPATTLGMLQETECYYNPFSKLTPARYLTLEEATQLMELITVADASRETMISASARLFQDAADRGAALVSGLIGGFSGMTASSNASEGLQQKLSKEIGFGAQLAMLQFDNRRRIFTARVQTQIGRTNRTFFKDFEVQATPGGPLLTLQSLNPEYVEV